MKEITINGGFITLGNFLKYAGVCSSGAAAKNSVLQGKNKVSGQICFQRGRKLRNGDTVETENNGTYKVKTSET